MTHPAKGQKVNFQIEGRTYAGKHGESLLGALRHYGYEVPSLCFHEAVSAYGACRVCLVEVKKGRRTKVTTSCNYPIQEGIEVFLETEKVRKHRKVILQLLLAKAPESKEIADLAAEHGVTHTPFEPSAADRENKCILCGLCARVCAEVVEAHAIEFSGRGLNKAMKAPYDETAETCIACGACVVVCPTQCIGMREKDGLRSIDKWHRDLPMQKCTKCNHDFFPTFMLMEFSKRIGVDKKHFDVCPNCR
jgi:NADH dehydrogenase/NADH:ubiquinone oxidoreductase subunit G